MIGDDRLGVERTSQPKKIVLDFSSPNVAKPMHVGHLRSTVIGDALQRVLEFVGHDVTGDNHIGDWGTQFGMIIYGYKHFVDSAAYEQDAVGELARLYRLVNQLSDYHNAVGRQESVANSVETAQQQLDMAEAAASDDKKSKKALKKLRADVDDAKKRFKETQTTIQTVDNNPDLKALADAHRDIAAESRRETARLHAGDEENRALWDRFLPQCLSMLNAVYARLGIEFDLTLGESFYQPMLGDVVSGLEQAGIASESEGAVCVFMDGNNAPFIVRKSDGAFTYATTDLATIRYRIEQLNADVILYVVDARQSEHFNLLFDTAARWGFDRAELKHVSFGTILGDDKRPFKTRSGDTVGLESLLDEAVQRARVVIDANDDAKPAGSELDDAARSRIAESVGLGGIKYADLRHNRDSDYVFSWDKMLATTGDTATYMQYAHARICGIFRRGEIDRESIRTGGKTIALGASQERDLALQLVRFSEAIDDVTSDYRPNALTAYLFETANCFSRFYDNCVVLKEPDEATRTSRLLLCDLTARVIAKGLNLLGIDAPDQM